MQQNPSLFPSHLLPAPIQALNNLSKAISDRRLDSEQSRKRMIDRHFSLELNVQSCTDRKYNALVVVISGNVVHIDDHVRSWTAWTK
ncbi:hypothetical protein H5410_019155 [Solanum commersonii]|uniref:Uncharacterized protein n=1 Tax=Solanum commersonii TaxID=4109 RepID=A0A9J6A4W5_SOLCO|nr:hypothetical protein H5410_019155 [Solanum commersonii]